MFDLDPSALDDTRNSPELGRVFNSGSLISYKQDSANNYITGRNQTLKWRAHEVVMDAIRKAAELCDNLQGFFAYRSYGGGTGTGAGDVIMELMKDEYDHGFNKKKKFETAIYPSREYSSSVVEPYNCALSTANSKSLFDLTYMLDNQSAYEMCKKVVEIPKPKFEHLNAILAQVVSLSTLALRYESQLDANMDNICQNLVPSEQLRYPIVSLAPLRNAKLARHRHERFSPRELVRELFHPKSLLCDVKNAVSTHRWSSATLIFRGQSDAPDLQGVKAPLQAAEIYEAMRELTVHPKSLYNVPQFVPWVKNLGVKVGIVGEPPIIPNNCPFAKTDRQGALIGNSTCVREVFAREHIRFLKLKYNKAYMHHFVDAGMETDELAEADEQVLKLIELYDEQLEDARQGEEEEEFLLTQSRPTMLRPMNSRSMNHPFPETR